MTVKATCSSSVALQVVAAGRNPATACTCCLACPCSFAWCDASDCHGPACSTVPSTIQFVHPSRVQGHDLLAGRHNNSVWRASLIARCVAALLPGAHAGAPEFEYRLGSDDQMDPVFRRQCGAHLAAYEAAASPIFRADLVYTLLPSVGVWRDLRRRASPPAAPSRRRV